MGDAELQQQHELQELFAILNDAHFSGRLRQYRILVQREPVLSPGGRGYHDRGRREITVLLMEHDEMEGTLVHEMAHAATNDYHGAKWMNEMVRLFRCGAPLSGVDLRRLRLCPCEGIQRQPLLDSRGY